MIELPLEKLDELLLSLNIYLSDNTIQCTSVDISINSVSYPNYLWLLSKERYTCNDLTFIYLMTYDMECIGIGSVEDSNVKRIHMVYQIVGNKGRNNLFYWHGVDDNEMLKVESTSLMLAYIEEYLPFKPLSERGKNARKVYEVLSLFDSYLHMKKVVCNTSKDIGDVRTISSSLEDELPKEIEGLHHIITSS